MTVGIAFTNGLEAIAITDSRASGSSRQTDSVNKMGDFSEEKYAGVVFGTGSASLVEGVIGNLNGFSAENLDKFVKSVHKNYKGRIDHLDDLYLAAMLVEIEKKAHLIENEDEKKQFTRQELSKVMSEYDKSKNRFENITNFLLVGYDKEKCKVRLFTLDPFISQELNSNHIEMGSGTDGANLYLGTKLQGIDSTKLELADLTFFALNAYATSTVNKGVGGTPKIARISKDGCEILPVEKAIALANLSGAYLSEFPASVLSHESTRMRFKEILDCAKPKYAKIAKEIGLNENTLRTMYITYSSWQERANRTLFNRK
jgi:hypothetical protein